MESTRIKGLVAATVTPFRKDGGLNLELVAPLVDHLLGAGVNGLYVCGSTGEGVSLTDQERQSATEAYIEAAAGRVPVVVQVGHNSLASATRLARHAATAGADAISATCPSYFKIEDIDVLIDSMELVAGGAPNLPFYFYHIPSLTGAQLSMPEFLQRGGQRISNLAGMKFTSPVLHDYQECVELNDAQFDVLWGADEMLLGAFATGAQGAVGSTYNIAAPLYRGIIDALERGDLIEARRLQSLAGAMIRILLAYPFHAALRSALRLLGFECGLSRLPLKNLSTAEERDLQSRLKQIGFPNLTSVPREFKGQAEEASRAAAAPNSL